MARDRRAGRHTVGIGPRIYPGPTGAEPPPCPAPAFRPDGVEVLNLRFLLYYPPGPWFHPAPPSWDRSPGPHSGHRRDPFRPLVYATGKTDHYTRFRSHFVEVLEGETILLMDEAVTWGPDGGVRRSSGGRIILNAKLMADLAGHARWDEGRNVFVGGVGRRHLRECGYILPATAAD